MRVLDLTRVVACPMATQLLGFLGADVLRIDPPPTPELLDQYLAAGMGKRSIELDLGANRDTVEDLPAGADVQVLGHRPGSLDRFGLAPQALLESHPQLVVRTHSAWGETGPWTQRPGFDSIVQAASGIAVACCDHDPESAGGAATRPGGAAGGDGEGAHAARSPGVSASGADLRGQALTASVGGYGAASPGWS